MGWNKGYEIFEQTVVQTYNTGKLDQEILSILMEPYRDTDIDSGGREGLLSADGLCVEEIVIKTFGGALPKKPALPGNYNDWTNKQYEENDAYMEKLSNKFYRITKKFGWC